MSKSFNLIWSKDGAVVHQGSSGILVLPVAFPGKTSDVQTIQLRSSALENGTFDILTGVKFYLTGNAADLEIVQKEWPNLGLASGRPEMSGGVQISFDGKTWKTFSKVQAGVAESVGLGDQSDPTTWLDLPQLAVGTSASAGVLGPYDTATFMLRYVIPSTADEFKVFDVRLAIDFDIV